MTTCRFKVLAARAQQLQPGQHKYQTSNLLILVGCLLTCLLRVAERPKNIDRRPVKEIHFEPPSAFVLRNRYLSRLGAQVPCFQFQTGTPTKLNELLTLSFGLVENQTSYNRHL